MELDNQVVIGVVTEQSSLVPVYSSAEAAGADVKAAIQEKIEIPAGEARLIPTGIRLDIPPGFEIQVRPRSGLALKSSVTVLNTPGTIDSDYQGEVGVILMNHGKNSFFVEPGMRIAQLVVARAIQATFIQQELLRSTKRGEGGFGHTGSF